VLSYQFLLVGYLVWGFSITLYRITLYRRQLVYRGQSATARLVPPPRHRASQSTRYLHPVRPLLLRASRGRLPEAPEQEASGHIQKQHERALETDVGDAGPFPPQQAEQEQAVEDQGEGDEKDVLRCDGVVERTLAVGYVGQGNDHDVEGVASDDAAHGQGERSFPHGGHRRDKLGRGGHDGGKK